MRVNRDGSFKCGLFQHEYGHYLQSQSVGPIYLFGYAIPSVINYKLDPDNHKHFKIEQDANKRALMYFLKNVPGFDYSKNWSSSNPIDDKGWLLRITNSYQSANNKVVISSNWIDNIKSSLDTDNQFVKQLSIYQ